MKRRRLLIALTVLVGVVLAGILIWALTRPPSVEDAAEDYLTALAEGDYPAIVAMSDSGLDTTTEATLADAFAGATYGTAPEVEEITPSQGFTGVRSSMEFAGERHTVFFGMALRDGRWTVATDYLAVLEVATGIGDSVWVGDALVPVGEVLLLPAVYPVSPAPRAVLDGGTEVAVSNDEPVSVALDATLTENAAAQVQAQLDPYLDECTAPGAVVPDACGIRIPWAADLATLETVSYRIERRPAVALAPAEGSFAATGGVLVVTATGTTHAGAPGEFTYRADDWALYGSIAFRGDELVLAVR